MPYDLRDSVKALLKQPLRAMTQKQYCDVLANSVKGVKLSLRAMTQKQYCDALLAYSVKEVLRLSLRAMARNQPCDFSSCAQRKKSVENNFVCDSTGTVV